MSFVATAIIGSGVIGAGASIYGSTVQQNSANKAISASQNMFDISRATNAPFVAAGQGAAGTLSDLLKPGGDMTSILKTIPGFDFINQLSQMGVANQGTTTGLGGNTLLAGANAGTNVALSSGWQPIVNALQTLTNSGVSAAGNVTGAATATGGQIGNAAIGAGNAGAAGVISAGTNIGNSLTTSALITKLLNGSTGMYATPADAGKGAAGDFGSGGYNFLDKAAGTSASYGG